MTALFVNRLIATAAVFTVISGTAFGQQHGAVPIRIPDVASRCINGQTDQVYLTLYRVVTTKKNGWFSNQNQAELLIKVSVLSNSQADKTPTFPVAAKANIRDFQAGQISIPLEYTVVSGLGLKAGNRLYSALAIDITLVNLESRSGVGNALQALTEITGSKKLPIPASPLTAAAGYLLDFANAAITKDMDAKNGDDKLTTASLSLNFDPSPTADCTGTTPSGAGFESTGVKAILSSEGGTTGDGYVPIDKTNDYCFTAETTPAFILKAAKKVAGKACADPSYNALFKQVSNNYVAFFLQKRPISATLGGGSAIVNRDRNESRTLCDQLKMSNCAAAR